MVASVHSFSACLSVHLIAKKKKVCGSFPWPHIYFKPLRSTAPSKRSCLLLGTLTFEKTLTRFSFVLMQTKLIHKNVIKTNSLVLNMLASWTHDLKSTSSLQLGQPLSLLSPIATGTGIGVGCLCVKGCSRVGRAASSPLILQVQLCVCLCHMFAVLCIQVC